MPVTLDTSTQAHISTAHDNRLTKQGLLTLVRPHNHDGPRAADPVPLVRMAVAGVVVRVIDEDLVEVWVAVSCAVEGLV